MLAWAIRTLAIWGVFGTVAYLLYTGDLLQGAGPTPSGTAAVPVAAAPSRAKVGNSMVVPADRYGHYFVTAEVNGAPIRFLVDTGASIVALTPEDARSAGFDRGQLSFTGRSQTANGVARHAPVTLREIRISQITQHDVDAVVMAAPGGISLLGMNFLKQLDAYEIRDGKLTLWW